MPDGSRPIRQKTLLVADLFCGAGGSSTGARRALAARGFAMDLVAVNHWDVAIETHSRNHPEARHYLRDLMSADPIALVSEGKLDLLMASPTCTHHSRARGGKPSSDQQRMDPWAIIRWCSELRVKRLLVENVSEFCDWGPIDLRTGRPIKSRKGEYFRAWVGAITALGGRFDYRILNCADYGDATTRIRFFGQARFDGKPIRWPVPTHSRDGDLFGAEKWRAAREIIDWNLRGRSIFGRKKGLAPKTLDRIITGAVKFNWPSPLIEATRAELRRQLHATIARSETALKTAMTPKHRKAASRARDWCEGRLCRLDAEASAGASSSNPQPIVLTLRQNDTGRGRDEPIPTLCAGGRHVGMVEPFVLSQASGGVARGVSDPVPSIPCGGAHALICPYYGSGSGETCTNVDAPLPTCTAKARFGFVMPITHGGDGARARSLDEPLATITTAHRGEFACIVAAFGERDGQAPRVHSVDEPAPAICARGRIQLAQAVVIGRDIDVLFRMLDPRRELARAMSFSDDEAEYVFAGTKTDITKQVGNAIPVRTATALVGAMLDD